MTNRTVLLYGGISLFGLGITQAFSLSAPQILAARTGLDAVAVGWLVSAGGIVGVFTMLANAWHSDRHGERFWHIVAPLLLVSLAYVVIGMAPVPIAVMAAYIFLQGAIFAYQGLQPTYMSQNIPARDLGIGFATLNSIAGVGAFVAPILFGMARDATGSYDLGLSLLPLSPLIAIGFLFAARHHSRSPVTAIPAAT